MLFSQSGQSIALSNRLIEMEVDGRTGRIQALRHKSGKLAFTVPDEPVWPFGVSTGAVGEPRHRRMEIRTDGRQLMTYRLYREASGGDLTLKMLYADLKDEATGENGGVQLEITISLEPGHNYFTVGASLANRGSEPITEFYAWRGAGLTTSDPEPGRLVFPYGGAIPNEDALKNGMVFASPSIFLSMGWADFSSRRGGIGIGYLNRQDITSSVKIRKGERAAEVSWTFFNLESVAPRFGLHRHPPVYPLGPGERFDSYLWILVVHDGDGHQTADAYRQNYEEVFAGDYRSWDQVSGKAKQIDLWAGMKT